MTLKEAEQNSIHTLTSLYEKTEATAISDWLLEHITGYKKTQRNSFINNLLTKEQVVFFEEAITRLKNDEPIQYVLNESFFYGEKFYVDKNVLIPRPETEELVDYIIKQYAQHPKETLTIIDIGTGSGCIPISLKKHIRNAGVWSCDISYEAIQVAKNNAANLNADIHFLEADFLQENNWNQLPHADIIVSNPPYIPEKDKTDMHKNVLDFEPHTALFVTNENPLIFYTAIADFANKKLNSGGYIFLEIHESLGALTAALFPTDKYRVEIIKDMQGKDRIVKVLKYL